MNIEELYRTYFDIVYRYIRSVSRDGSLAEEVTQETFFKALKKADQFRGVCDFKYRRRSVLYPGDKSRRTGSSHCHCTLTDFGVSCMLVLYDPQI